MNGRLAIASGFEAPPVQPASAAGSVSQTTAAPRTAGQGNISSAFANLIQEFAEAAPSALPAAVASPKSAPLATQQAAALPAQAVPESPVARSSPPAPARKFPEARFGAPLPPTPQLPAAQPGSLAPTTELPTARPSLPAHTAIGLPPPAPDDATPSTQARSATQAKIEPTPDLTVSDGDKPPAPPPAPTPSAPPSPLRKAVAARRNPKPPGRVKIPGQSQSVPHSFCPLRRRSVSSCRRSSRTRVKKATVPLV